MKVPLLCLAFLYFLSGSYGYKTCSYRTYSSYYHGYVTHYYRCSSSQYCCDYHRCCTYTYTRWYLWFILVTIGFVIFLIWWYYRYRYLPGRRIAAPVQVTRRGPAVIADSDMNVVRVNPTQAVYPQVVPITVMPGDTSMRYMAYPPPVYQQPPPAYASVVKNGTTVTPTTIQ